MLPGAGRAASPDKFCRDAAAANATEMAIAKLAAKRAMSPHVREMADLVLANGATLGRQLDAVTRKDGVILAVGNGDPATVAQLKKLSGAAFDAALMDEMVTRLRHDVEVYEAASVTADSGHELALAALSTLRSTLDRAVTVDFQVDGGLARTSID